MIILFKTKVSDSQILKIQSQLKIYSQRLLMKGLQGLILGSFSDKGHTIPQDWIEEIIEYPDKLYFCRHPSNKSFDPIIKEGHILSIAGPCSVESEHQIFECARLVKKFGGEILRGGAFKPRSSCYDFQGLGLDGLKLLHQAARHEGLLCVSEVLDCRDLDAFLPLIDVIQVGARNMQNFALLKELGHIDKPILLKRGLSATYQEFLSSAEYIMSLGNPQVILCERGIRTFETSTRNTLDISAIPYLKSKTHCPVIVDPSHAVGLRQFVPQLAYAAVAAGADGIMVEVHPHPEQSISDANQTISPEIFANMSLKLSDVAKLFGKSFGAK
jgi:3-deoxy-7-phosphoheptulonate synthase